MTRLRLLPLLAVLAFISGCDYERIDILVGSDLYRGRVMSYFEDVEVQGRSIVMKPGAKLSIQVPQTTQFLAQLEVAIRSGDGFVAYLRTVPHDFDSTHGIAFRYAVDGCTVRMVDGATIPLRYNAETTQQIVSLYNEAALVSISAGCDRLFEQYTDVPCTEYLILETLPGSTVELRSINFFNTDTP